MLYRFRSSRVPWTKQKLECTPYELPASLAKCIKFLRWVHDSPDFWYRLMLLVLKLRKFSLFRWHPLAWIWRQGVHPLQLCPWSICGFCNKPRAQPAQPLALWDDLLSAMSSEIFLTFCDMNLLGAFMNSSVWRPSQRADLALRSPVNLVL